MWSISWSTSREICKEEFIRAIAAAFLILAAIIGCGKPKSESENKANATKSLATTKKKAEPIAIAIGPASNTRMVTWTYQKLWFSSFRSQLWYIQWDSANLAMVNGKQSGFMFKVSGRVFENDEPAGEFFADHAEADKAVDRLILDGGIKITSDKSVMTAKKVEWLAGNEVFKASGDVLLNGPDGQVGPIDVLFVSAKLKKVATSLSYFLR